MLEADGCWYCRFYHYSGIILSQHIIYASAFLALAPRGFLSGVSFFTLDESLRALARAMAAWFKSPRYEFLPTASAMFL
jgi:hypothetical protein